MNTVFLTKSDTFFIGFISDILGYIMEGIFNVLDFIGIPNVGLSIILFTIVVYLLMLPLTIKQQKFSKLSAKMNPELNAIREKYKNRRDNESAMQMNAETQAVYAKYGVSPSGSCVQLLIQMPILFALYPVIYKMPAYVRKIGDTFRVLAKEIAGSEKGLDILTDTVNTAEKLAGEGTVINESVVESIAKTVQMYGQQISTGATEVDVQNGIIDVLNKLSSTDMSVIANHYGLNDLMIEGEYILSTNIEGTTGLIDTYNNFLGLNMGNSPSYMVNEAISTGAWLMVVAAIAIPALAAITQWINVKLMPSQATDNTNKDDPAASMASSMKMMNMMMPLMSAFFCWSLPAGMGLYWIAGSVVRTIQQIVINKHFDKMDLNEIIEKNKEKSAKKMAKIQEQQKKYAEYAAMNTRNLSAKDIYAQKVKEANEKLNNNSSTSTSTKTSNAKPGSLMARANMVKDFNEKNNKQ
ncbi:MAG: YidC/Oxa1 family membrane protein insertase [Lachnospiraceae bacterium]|nr:YidC/Oxa1 family membrane protein insertase [Lachnospiraceae bacterium]